MIVLFAFASFTALREFITLTETRRGDHYALVAAFFVVLPVQYCLIAIDWYGLYSIFIPVYAFLFMPIIAALRADTTRFMERDRGRAMGADAGGLLRQPRAGAAHARHPRLRGPRAAPDRLPGARRAVERRAAICVGQALRQAQDRAATLAVEDLGRLSRRRRLGDADRRARSTGSRRSRRSQAAADGARRRR